MSKRSPDLLTSGDIAQATARLRSAHERETGAIQRAVDHLTAVVGMPGFVAVLTVAISLWMAFNVMAKVVGLRPIDPPPFTWLQGAIGTLALYVAALILSTQRRADQLSSHREQLILELAILNDQKASKIIGLLEEVRRDNPMIADRVDDQAHAMSTPSDPNTVLEAIKDVRDERG